MIDDRRSPCHGALRALALVLGSMLASVPLRAQDAPRVALARAADATRGAPPTRRARRRSPSPTTLDGAKTPNAFAPGDSVDVEYELRGEWLPARVTEVLNDGYAYAVTLAPYDDGTVVDAQIHYSRVRAHSAAAAGPESSGTHAAPAAARDVPALPAPSVTPAAPAAPTAPAPASWAPARAAAP